MIKDFKAFILRGNVVELAVGVVIGVAFGRVITSLVEDILTPLLGLFSVPDFAEATANVGDAAIRYGLFINALISFLMIAFAVFFFVVRPVNALMARRKTEPEVDATTTECGHCLSNIPVGAVVCAFCTRDVTAA